MVDNNVSVYFPHRFIGPSELPGLGRQAPVWVDPFGILYNVHGNRISLEVTCKHRHWNTGIVALESAMALELASILHLCEKTCRTDQGVVFCHRLTSFRVDCQAQSPEIFLTIFLIINQKQQLQLKL